MAKSIVQGTHSHNPPFLFGEFTSTIQLIELIRYSIIEYSLLLSFRMLKENIQIHVLLVSIIHICSNEIVFFLPQVLSIDYN